MSTSLSNRKLIRLIIAFQAESSYKEEKVWEGRELIFVASLITVLGWTPKGRGAQFPLPILHQCWVSAQLYKQNLGGERVSMHGTIAECVPHLIIQHCLDFNKD